MNSHQSHITRNLNAGKKVSPEPQQLHSGKVTVSPLLALFFGGGGVGVGMTTNCWQVWTSAISFILMINAKGGLLNFLPATTPSGQIPFNRATVTTFISWLLAIAVQFGVIFFSLRVDQEFLEQLSHAEGEKKGERVWDATKKTFVRVTHNRDFFFYYGMICYALDGLGDYLFCVTLTGNIVFLVAYGIILMGTSTLILALAAEWLWSGVKAFLNAWAQAQENARRTKKSPAAAGGGQ